LLPMSCWVMPNEILLLFPARGAPKFTAYEAANLASERFGCFAPPQVHL
jgi:hypothetical protein